MAVCISFILLISICSGNAFLPIAYISFTNSLSESSSLNPRAISAPASASASAHALPIPLAAPVTNAIFSLTVISSVFFILNIIHWIICSIADKKSPQKIYPENINTYAAKQSGKYGLYCRLAVLFRKCVRPLHSFLLLIDPLNACFLKNFFESALCTRECVYANSINLMKKNLIQRFPIVHRSFGRSHKYTCL